MKRFNQMAACLVVLIVLMLCLSACGNDAVEGSYTLIEIDAGDMSMSQEEMKVMADRVTINFYADGTGELNFRGEAIDFVWEGDELTTEDGKTRTFALEGDTLTFEMDGQTLVFKK